MRNELFDYNGKTYDVGFNKKKLSLYVVRDKLSGLVISEVIKCVNDLIAMKGFDYLVQKKQKDDKDFSVYTLQMVGVLDEEKAVIEAADCSQEICDSRDDLNDIIKVATEYVLSQVDEE